MFQHHDGRQERDRSKGGQAQRPGRAAGSAPAPARQASGGAPFWEEFAHRHGHDLVRCVGAAMRRLGWRADAGEVDELVQEVYCRVLDGRFPTSVGGWPPAQLWGYLNRIARSVVIDEVRSRCARKRGGARRGETAPAADAGGAALAERRAPGPTPEERLLARERARAVRRRVEELGGAEHGARNVRILELAAVEGCTAAEISSRLAGALTTSSIHTVLHRLRLQLTSTPGPELAAMMEG